MDSARTKTNLGRWMSLNKVTNRQLADAVGSVTPEAVRLWRSGRRAPRPAVQEQLLRAIANWQSAMESVKADVVRDRAVSTVASKGDGSWLTGC